MDAQHQPFFLKKDKIGLEDGCLFRGIRVIIPTKVQSRIILILHANHLGISRMKAIACWFGLDNDIERQG